MFSRGKAEYFHGREKEQAFFKNALKKTRSRGVGTSFLVQGSPGVGKTALLEKCK
ncbi:MAG: ATP-binding protein [Flavobacteriaceae bacterium]|nr:ATP-binding protein [Flavobacteriaceae bacterium]MCY4216464.1 ATP-binding protein [Flavobacteriaceae bacterium]MCY4253961.1 ATP-binding protein [Flavobacteriaceae bacterium]